MMKYKVINKFITSLCNNNAIDITDKKLIFLGCGSIAKCCLYYLNYFFIFDYKNIIIIDKLKREKYYPIVKYYLKNKSIFIEKEVTDINYVEFFDSLQLKEKDIIVDLTTETPTLCFFKYCRLNNLFYINTASEQYFLKPINSVAVQHVNYDDIVRKTKNSKNVTTLIEYGMNPGLVSSFTLKGIDDIANYFINKNNKNNKVDQELIDLYNLKCKERYSLLAKKLGIRVIHCSEIDTQVVTSNTLEKDKFYNTWSCKGLVEEGFEGIELAVGTHEKEIPLPMNNRYINGIFSSTSYSFENKFKSICPLKIENNKVIFTEIEGVAVQHGECISLYRFLSTHDYSPTMHYVYKLNKYAENIIYNNSEKEIDKMLLNQNKWEVLSPYNHDIEGYDNVGAFFILDNNTDGCTDNKNSIFTWWSGTIMSNDFSKQVLKDKMNLPTQIQVICGVLGGLYWALLPENQNKGLCYGENVDYKTVLSLTEKLLGKIYSGKTFKGSITGPKLVDLITTPVQTITKFRHI